MSRFSYKIPDIKQIRYHFFYLLEKFRVAFLHTSSCFCHCYCAFCCCDAMSIANWVELFFCCRCQYNISSFSCGWAGEWERNGEEAWQHVFSPNSFLFITVKSNLLFWDSSQHIITLLNVFRHNNGDKIYFNLKLTVFSRRFSPYSTAIRRPYFFSRTVHPTISIRVVWHTQSMQREETKATWEMNVRVSDGRRRKKT